MISMHRDQQNVVRNVTCFGSRGENANKRQSRYRCYVILEGVCVSPIEDIPPVTLSDCRFGIFIPRHLWSTSSSAIAEGPRDALSQLKSCQLLHNCTKNHI